MRSTALLALCALTALAGCSLPSIFPPNPPEGGTATPFNIETASPSPAIPPTSTPLPEVAVELGNQAIFNGDYTTARLEFLPVYTYAVDPDLRLEAVWGMARTEYGDRHFYPALPYLRELITDYPQSKYVPRAYFLTGLIYDELQRYTEAAAAYEACITLSSGWIDAYLQEYLGHALYNAGDYTASAAAFQAALAAPRAGDRTSLEITLARTCAAAGDLDTALTMYGTIAASTDDVYTKAQMDFLSGQAYYDQGLYDQAYQYFLHAVTYYPVAYDSYSALVALDGAGVAVNELDRGMTYYYAEEYGLALSAFNNFETANPGNDGNIYYFRGLTLRELGLFNEAVLDFDYLIANYPDNNYWESAWEEKAYTQWFHLGMYVTASQTLMAFADGLPGHVNSPTYMYDAARILERDHRLQEAAALWERMADRYPADAQVPLALFMAGIARYRDGDLEGAMVSFQRSLILSVDPGDQARAYVWIGKVHQEKRDPESARGSWTLAAGLDPGGYYSARAQDLLLGRGFFEAPPIYDLDFDPQVERADAEAWMRIIFTLPQETDLGDPGDLLNDPRLQRGTELWQLGLYEEARREFEELGTSVEEDPVSTYRLANYMYDLGLYRSAIFAARQVLALAGMQAQGETLTAPRYFNHIRYGAYYKELVVPAALENAMDPLFVFSVMRQESLFESFVVSSAGARGLMQIMPSTGRIIAGNYTWPLDYIDEDLFRPLVNIKFGTHELMTNRTHFNGNLVPALAAYNAGLTSALAWHDLAGDDPDLYLEVVRYQETRDYIRYILEIYSTYCFLYGSGR